ncbi:hypothetical protein [uncultured Williamsia sp.]|uniref:hypothetical protein n=1 Tax=uncultured Williamsia sp. TaxID=259311 RepID=UPI0034574994
MDPDIVRGLLGAERAEATALLVSMRARLSAVVDAAVDEHADDEHDPRAPPSRSNGGSSCPRSSDRPDV